MEIMTTNGIILSGGQGQRLNGEDKGLLMLNGEPLINHVVRVIKPQTQAIIISANRNSAQYQKLGYRVIADNNTNFLGPLAGIYSALSIVDTELALVVPCDTPFLPADLCVRLLLELTMTNADIAMAHDGNRLQPMCSLMRVSLAAELNQALSNGQRKAQAWMLQQHHCIVDFSDCADCFFNINQPEDLKAAAAQLNQH